MLSQFTLVAWSRKCEWTFRKAGIGCLVALALLFGFPASVFGQITYYVSTSGSTSNSGLSTNSPWPLTYALNTVGPSNTIMLLPGLWSNGNWQVRNSFTTIKSFVKWGAVLSNGTPFSGLNMAGPNISNAVIDGLRITANTNSGIFLSGSPNCTVRNCWVDHAGCAGRGTGIDGIYSPNLLVENCLVEYCGVGGDLIHSHGFYVSGTNILIRNNVVRYNNASGIQVNDNSGMGSTNVWILNNLIYGNNTWGFVSETSGRNTVNLINNTIICTNYCMTSQCHITSYMNVSNNILYGGKALMFLSDNPNPIAYQADYNITNRGDANFSPSSPHSFAVTTIDAIGFVNPNNGGLFWLQATSPAVGAGFSMIPPAFTVTNAQAISVYPQVDFFGVVEVNITDIGAFQYNLYCARDKRVLDPSPVSPNYWQAFTQMSPPTDLHIVPGSSH